MTRLSIAACMAMALFSNAASAGESALHQQLVAEDGWVAYNVPIVADSGSSCCYSGHGYDAVHRTRCDLDRGKGGFISNGDKAAGSPALSVYWHVVNGEPDQVRAYSADCPVTSKQKLRWIESVDPRDSITELARTVGHVGAGHDEEPSGLMAIALHADPSATRTLIGFAKPPGTSDVREKAIFWLGLARGREGADFVQQLAGSDPSADLREHAVFALSQSKEKDAYERVRSIFRGDASADVRGKALFWMAQMDDPRAKDDILAALVKEPSEDGREQAVFALSQLDEPVATSALIAVIRGDYPRTVKEKALFWLGQAGTDEAMAFLDDVLSR